MPSSRTTQIYTTPTGEDVIASVLAHHARRRRPGPAAEAPGRMPRRCGTGRSRWRSCSGGPAHETAPGRRPCPAGSVPAGGAPAAGGRGDLAALLAGSRRARRRRPGRPPGSRASRCWSGCSRRRSGWATATSQANRKAGMIQLVDWLESLPGGTWQERWAASGAEDGRADWRGRPRPVAQGTGPGSRRRSRAGCDPLGTGMLLLVMRDVLRPGLPFLLTAASRHLAAEMARTRDPAGFAGWRAVCETVPASPVATRAFRRIAAIMAAKGGAVADITVGRLPGSAAADERAVRSASDRNAVLLPADARHGRLPRRAAPPTCAAPWPAGSSRPGS